MRRLNLGKKRILNYSQFPNFHLMRAHVLPVRASLWNPNVICRPNDLPNDGLTVGAADDTCILPTGLGQVTLCY